MTLIPVIMAGGAGTRLWPVSRALFPKPFMRLPDGQSLLEKTMSRAAGLAGASGLLLVTNREYIFQSHDEYARVDSDLPLSGLLEPVGRNTAPALAMAAQHVRDAFGGDAIMMVMAADHVVGPQDEFGRAVESAAALARDGWIVTFGVKPAYPETGYGYIEVDRARSLGPGFAVAHFREKPDFDTASRYVADGNHFWNSGMFCFRADSFLDELAALQPALAKNAAASWAATRSRQAKLDPSSRNIEIDKETFVGLADISVDYAVIEKSRKVAVVLGDFEWSDIGSWRSVSELTAPDDDGNRVVGEGILLDTRNTYVQSDSRVIAAVGVENLMIVDTPDALLVADRDRAQDVKKVTEQLRARNHEAQRLHKTVHRPWGTYTVLEDGAGHKIKRIEVRPGASLSLQLHHHRSEHWVVVEGVAQVVRGEETVKLVANQSTYIPAETRHRLENIGKVPLVLIEVQTGSYLGEDDIVRFEDNYGRA